MSYIRCPKQDIWLVSLLFVNKTHFSGTFQLLKIYLLYISMHVCCFSLFQLFVTPWTVNHQASLPTGFSRKEYWSGLSCPPPGDLPNPGIEPCLLHLLHWQGGRGFFTTSSTWKTLDEHKNHFFLSFLL